MSDNVERAPRSIGYARVSTKDQKLQLQLDALNKEGCDVIFRDQISGTKKDRPGLNEALAVLRPGDTLVVWSLDRLGRSMVHLLTIVQDLKDRGVFFRTIKGGISYDGSAMGSLMVHVMAAFAEFERVMIVERTMAGIEAARSEGRIGGRPRVTADDPRVVKILELQLKEVAPGDIAQMVGVSKSAMYRLAEIGRKALKAEQEEGS